MKFPIKINGKLFLRRMEYLKEEHCIVCKKAYITNHYWSHGGHNMNFDHWVIGSVYCSTKCSKKGHKMFKEL